MTDQIKTVTLTNAEMAAYKPSNPKDAVGIKKVPFSTIPAGVLAEVAVAMAEGALKYGRHNYRTAGVRASVYYDAAFRHLTAWWEGENTDPDSGLSHITKAIASLIVVRDSMLSGNWTDDRPPSNPVPFGELNAVVAGLLEKYPNPPAAHTNILREAVVKRCNEALKAWGDHEASLKAKPRKRK